MPFVRGQLTKTAKETCESIESVLADRNCLVNAQLVVQFHSHVGQEFWQKDVSTSLRSKYIVPTCTAGYDPWANGKEERDVGIIKNKPHLISCMLARQ